MELRHKTRHDFLTRLAAETPTRDLPAPHGSTMMPDLARPLPNILANDFSCWASHTCVVSTIAIPAFVVVVGILTFVVLATFGAYF